MIAFGPTEEQDLIRQTVHEFAEGDHRAKLPYYANENIARTNAFLDRIKPLAKKKNVLLSQLVLRWTIEQPGITIALVGARNAEQAIQNAKAIEVKLDSEEIQFISDELSHLQLITA